MNYTKMSQNKLRFITCIDFHTLSLSEKLEIKKLGRPTPPLDLIQQDAIGSRRFTRRFSEETYKKNNWICGCDTLNALFCFPCALFYTAGMDATWSRKGCRDLKHLHVKILKHEQSAQHMNSCTELALLGSENIVQLDSVYRENIVKHNKQVTRNRFILKRIINCIKFCGMLKLVPNDYCENDFDIFQELINLDATLKEHRDNATFFRNAGTYRMIETDILDSILAVCHQQIKKQIDETDFLAIECDDTEDISNQCKLIMIIRYVHNGIIQERFWTSLTDNLTQYIEDELEILIPNSRLKLISQTYNGRNITSSAAIKQKYENAHVVNCYAHQINLIVQKVTGQNSNVRIFFENLSSIVSFFSSSIHQCDILQEIVERKLPEVIWTCDLQTVSVVLVNHEVLIECFEEIEKKCNKTITCKEAYNLRRTLQDSDFVFWLNLFHEINPHVNTLYNQSQIKNKYYDDFVKDLQEFENKLLSLRDAFYVIKEEMDDNKRRRVSSDNEYDAVAKEICDTIIFQLKERLKYRGYLEAESLLNVSKFPEFSKTFPTSTVSAVVGYYPMLQEEKLKIELKVIYARRQFRSVKGCLSLLSWISRHGLNKTYSETTKLLKIVLTTPVSTDEPDRCFPTFKRTKMFLGNTVDERRFNALAMVSINKDFIHNIRDFDEKVMDHFVSLKDRERDFQYKE